MLVGLRTEAQALAAAKAAAAELDLPMSVWVHVGGTTPAGVVVARGTYLVRASRLPDPRWGCWKKVGECAPPVVVTPTPAAPVKQILRRWMGGRVK